MRGIDFCVLLQSQNTAVSSSSLVRTSGFHPGNRGSNPLETTNKNHRATYNLQVAFLVLMVNLFLSIKHILPKKRLFSLSIFLLTFFFCNTNLNSQELLFGFTGGANMNTISTKSDDGGLKVGINIGGLTQYRIDQNKSIIANLKLSTKGQQFSKIQENQNEHFKIYHTTTLYYIDIPIMFKYHYKDLIGIGAGPSFNFCLGGKDKSQIGNEPWSIRKFEKGLYNPFEFGLAFGVFTNDLGQSSFNNIFIEFNCFLGLTNIFKNYDRNTNTGVFVNIGYIIEQPLKKK